MILIIGGFAAGKREYARSLGYREEDFTREIEGEQPVLYGLQDLVSENPADAMDWLPRLLQKQAVICDEVGCGVTPLDREERAWREQVGRACCRIAAESEAVYRVYCGLGVRIK